MINFIITFIIGALVSHLIIKTYKRAARNVNNAKNKKDELSIENKEKEMFRRRRFERNEKRKKGIYKIPFF